MSPVRMMHEPSFFSLPEESEGSIQSMRKRDLGFRELNAILTKPHESIDFTQKYVTEIAAKATDVNRVSIWSYNKEKEAIKCEDLYVMDQDKHEKGMTLSADEFPRYFEAITTKKYISADDALEDSNTNEFESYLKEYDIHSMLDFRITVAQQLGGIICFENTGYKRKWTFNDQMFANAVGDTMALIWEAKERDRQNKLLSKRNQELKLINQELDQFVFSLSHDVRAPLTSIMGLIDLMRLEEHGENMQKYLDLQELSLKRLDQFIVSTSGMLKNRDLSVNPEVLRINPLINKILQLIEFIPNRDKIDINLNTTQNHNFYTDKSKLTIIIQNLIMNAIEYCDIRRGSSFLNIEALIDDDVCQLTFKDNGYGIKPNKLAQIINIFTSKRKHTRPVGLGLSIVKDQLDQLKGTINIDSSLGVGTTIIVKVPNMKDKS